MLSEKEVKELNIYELRKYAKKCGVKSPTSKKKEVLFDELYKIRTGEIKPEFTNMGRPVIQNRQNFFDFMELLKEFKELLKSYHQNDDESLYGYYRNNMSSFSEVETVVNIYDYKDFMIFFDELIKNSFEAEVVEIKNGLYKLIFERQVVFVKAEEKII